jgi:hypothetical protein
MPNRNRRRFIPTLSACEPRLSPSVFAPPTTEPAPTPPPAEPEPSWIERNILQPIVDAAWSAYDAFPGDSVHPAP